MDRDREHGVERESDALRTLQAAAGLVDRSKVERLDWMYEQSVAQKSEEELMSMPVAAQSDKDLEDVKALQQTTPGSMFLKSATRTSEDMLRKLREDPLFQIKRQEQAARESMLANPLVMAKVKKRAEKAAAKQRKKEKKRVKKEKKRAKKEAKRDVKKAQALKAKGKKSSGSSDSSDGSSSAGSASLGRRRGSPSPKRPCRGVPDQGTKSRLNAGSGLRAEPDLRHLGPDSNTVSKREEYAARVASQKEAALASRGAPRRMNDEEKQRRLQEMQADARRHESSKDQRIAAASRKEREQEEADTQMRRTSDQKYFREMREQAYAEGEGTVADRLRSQRHRRQRQIVDPLERDE